MKSFMKKNGQFFVAASLGFLLASCGEDLNEKASAKTDQEKKQNKEEKEGTNEISKDFKFLNILNAERLKIKKSDEGINTLFKVKKGDTNPIQVAYESNPSLAVEIEHEPVDLKKLGTYGVVVRFKPLPIPKNYKPTYDDRYVLVTLKDGKVSSLKPKGTDNVFWNFQEGASGVFYFSAFKGNKQSIHKINFNKSPFTVQQILSDEEMSTWDYLWRDKKYWYVTKQNHLIYKTSDGKASIHFENGVKREFGKFDSRDGLVNGSCRNSNGKYFAHQFVLSADRTQLLCFRGVRISNSNTVTDVVALNFDATQTNGNGIASTQSVSSFNFEFSKFSPPLTMPHIDGRMTAFLKFEDKIFLAQGKEGLLLSQVYPPGDSKTYLFKKIRAHWRYLNSESLILKKLIKKRIENRVRYMGRPLEPSYRRYGDDLYIFDPNSSKIWKINPKDLNQKEVEAAVIGNNILSYQKTWFTDDRHFILSAYKNGKEFFGKINLNDKAPKVEEITKFEHRLVRSLMLK